MILFRRLTVKNLVFKQTLLYTHWCNVVIHFCNDIHTFYIIHMYVPRFQDFSVLLNNSEFRTDL